MFALHTLHLLCFCSLFFCSQRTGRWHQSSHLHPSPWQRGRHQERESRYQQTEEWYEVGKIKKYKIWNKGVVNVGHFAHLSLTAKNAVGLRDTFCSTLFSSVSFCDTLIVRWPVLNHMVLLLSKTTLLFLQLEHRLSLTDPSKVMMVMMIMIMMVMRMRSGGNSPCWCGKIKGTIEETI